MFCGARERRESVEPAGNATSDDGSSSSDDGVEESKTVVPAVDPQVPESPAVELDPPELEPTVEPNYPVAATEPAVHEEPEVETVLARTAREGGLTRD